MKKLFIILAILANLFCYCQKDTLIDKVIYKVLYSQKLKNPIRVSYVVSKQYHLCDREGLSFYKEPSVITSNSSDYKSNDYDKGHMAPAESFTQNCEDLKKTFSYLNCSVQHYQLNRGAWKLLELKERQWSESYKVSVLIEIIFDKYPKKTLGGASIPSFYKKTIYLSNGQIYVFMFPNAKCSNNIWDYKLEFKK